jgi:hypothetical protein
LDPVGRGGGSCGGGSGGGSAGKKPAAKKQRRTITVITVQEKSGSGWQSLERKLTRNYSKLRQNGGAFLVYSILDCIVDHLFPVLDYLRQRLVHVHT